MLRLFRLILPAFLLLAMSTTASAQRALRPLGIQAQFTQSSFQRRALNIGDDGGTPRWLKWGIVGAVAGAALFAAAGQSNTDAGHSVAGDALYGAATGFVLVGGSIALWDWLCSGNTSSRRAGMCGG